MKRECRVSEGTLEDTPRQLKEKRDAILDLLE
jgi:hypothetical protein